MSASDEVAPNTLDSMSDAVVEPPDASSSWRLESFAQSLTSLSDNTVTAYVADVRGFAEWAARAGITDPSAVKRTVIRRYLAYLTTRQYARRSIARKTASLRRYYQWSVRQQLASVDPTLGVHTGTGEGRLPRVLDQRDLGELLERPGPEGEPVWRRTMDDAVLEVLYGSGLRVSELCGLDTSSLDLDAAAVVVWGKGSKQRRVPLSQPSVAALRAWLPIRHEVVPADGPEPARVVRQRARAPPHASRRPPHHRSAVAGAHASPRPAPQLRHSPARWWGRPASGPGAARASGRGDHAALHARQPRAVAVGVQLGTPTSMSERA